MRLMNLLKGAIELYRDDCTITVPVTEKEFVDYEAVSKELSQSGYTVTEKPTDGIHYTNLVTITWDKK